MSMFRTYRDLERIPSKVKQGSHTTVTSYDCNLCEQGGWTSESEVEIHRKTTHLQRICSIIRDKKKFPCTICAVTHENKDSLYQHIKSVHFMSSKNAERIEREIFICNHCCRLFFNKFLLEIHIVRKHQGAISKNWRIKCQKCFRELKKTTLWGHLEYHHMSSVSTCPICLEKCASRANLSDHLRKHRKHYHCGVCEFTTKFEESFSQHLQSHRKIDGNTTNFEDSYSNHLRSHRKINSRDTQLHKYFVPKFKPDTNVFYSVPSIMKGLKLSNNIHVCIICRQICVSKSDMKEHLMLDHTSLEVEKKRVYMCLCKEVFFNKILLKQHVFKEKDAKKHRVMDEAEMEEAIRETTPNTLQPSDEEIETEEIVTEEVVTEVIVDDEEIVTDLSQTDEIMVVVTVGSDI